MTRWKTHLSMRWLWIALALAPGCERKQEPLGPSCEQVADHVNEVARKAYPGHADMMPAGSRKAYVASCEARKLTGKQRRCMIEAQSMEALALCMPKDKDKADGKKPAAPAVPPAPGVAPGAAPAPAPAAPAPAAPAPAAPAAPAPAAPAAPAPAAPPATGP